MADNKQETNEAEEPMVAKDPKDVRSRNERPTGSVHFGDVDFSTDIVMDATWGEVAEACCVHTPQEWGMVFVGLILVLFFLYFFLFGLDLLGNSAKVMGGCRAGELFGSETNPIAGLMVGILATVLLQSSSTTTSIVVSLVGTSVSLDQGIYMIMGANIGTSVTNTIVAMGQMGDGDQLERAFAGATVHDLFNFLSVAVMLPLEAASGYLHELTGAMVKNAKTKEGEKWEGPLKKIVGPLAAKVIKANKKVIKTVAKGGNCTSFYPIECEDGIISAETCHPGLISCDSDTNECPAFFDVNATEKDDKVAGGVCFFISIFILFTCLAGLVTVLQKMLMGVSTRIIYKATNINGYLAMLVGAAITVVVQSSSITTSALTPIVGVGIIRLEEMLPITLGANIGTTLTAIMAAMVAEGIEPLQVALAHLMFNITGIVIWYPVPFMRKIPLHGARQLGKATRLWRGFPLVYIFSVFVIGPALLMGLSALFEQGNKGWTTLGSFLTILIAVGLGYTGYWCHFKQGKEKMSQCFAERQRRRQVMEELPEDMEYLKAKITALVDHTGLPDEEEHDLEADAPKAGELENKEERNSATSDENENDNEIQT